MRTTHRVPDIDAGIDPVYRALTEPQGLVAWWSTKVETDKIAVGEKIRFTFAGDFNPVMEITAIEAGKDVNWRGIEGHQNWRNNTFRAPA